MSKVYNISKLYNELKAAGVPMHGFSNTLTADICYAEEASEQNKASAEQIKLDHVPYDYREMRAKEYEPIGDQLDRLYKSMKAAKSGNPAEEMVEVNIWIANIDAVKTKWTKNYADLTTENKAYVDEYYERKMRK